jgi:hypothetical protein
LNKFREYNQFQLNNTRPGAGARKASRANACCSSRLPGDENEVPHLLAGRSVHAGVGSGANVV